MPDAIFIACAVAASAAAVWYIVDLKQRLDAETKKVKDRDNVERENGELRLALGRWMVIALQQHADAHKYSLLARLRFGGKYPRIVVERFKDEEIILETMLGQEARPQDPGKRPIDIPWSGEFDRNALDLPRTLHELADPEKTDRVFREIDKVMGKKKVRASS